MAQARGLAECTARPALRREMKPKLQELLRGAKGPAFLALATVASCGGASASQPSRLSTDLCATPSAAATGSTFRAGNARPAARRGRQGRGARRLRRCGGPGSRAPTADAAAARSLGHPYRAPAPARRRLQQAARPGPGGGSECRRRAGGAQEAASGVTGGTDSGAGQHTGGLGFSAGGRAPSRRPPCRSMVCRGKQNRFGDSGVPLARGSPPLPLPTPSSRANRSGIQTGQRGWERSEDSLLHTLMRRVTGAALHASPRAHTHRPSYAWPARARSNPTALRAASLSGP